MKYFAFFLLFLTILTGVNAAAAPDPATLNMLGEQRSAMMSSENLSGVEEMLLRDAMVTNSVGANTRMWYEDIVPGVNLSSLVGFLYQYLLWPAAGLLLAIAIVGPMMQGNPPDYVDHAWRLMVFTIFLMGATPIANTMLTLQKGFPTFVMWGISKGEGNTALEGLLSSPPVGQAASTANTRTEAFQYYLGKVLSHAAAPGVNGGLNVDVMTPILYTEIRRMSLPKNVTPPGFGKANGNTYSTTASAADIETFKKQETQAKLRLMAEMLKIYLTYDKVLQENIAEEEKAITETTLNPIRGLARQASKIEEGASNVILGTDSENSEGLKRWQIRELKTRISTLYLETIARAGIIRNNDGKLLKDDDDVKDVLGAVPSNDVGALALIVMQIIQTLTDQVNKWSVAIITWLAAVALKIQFFLLMLMAPFFLLNKTEAMFKGAFNICIKIVIWPAVAGALFMIWSIFCKNLMMGVIGGAGLGAVMGSAVSPWVLVVTLVFYIVGMIFIGFASPGLSKTIISGGAIAGALGGVALKAGLAALAAGFMGAKIATSSLAKGANSGAGGLMSKLGSGKTMGGAGGGGDGGAPAGEGAEGGGGGGGGVDAGGGGTPATTSTIPSAGNRADPGGLAKERTERTQAHAQKALGNTMRGSGKAAEVAGTGMDRLGSLADSVGQGLMSTKLGAFVGAPLSLGGKALKGAGQATNALGKTVADSGKNVADGGTGKAAETAALAQEKLDGLKAAKFDGDGNRILELPKRADIATAKALAAPVAPSKASVWAAKSRTMAMRAAKMGGKTALFTAKVAANMAMVPTDSFTFKQAGTSAANLAAYTATKGDMSKLTQYQVTKAVVKNIGNITGQKEQANKGLNSSILKVPAKAPEKPKSVIPGGNIKGEELDKAFTDDAPATPPPRRPMRL